MALSPSPPFRLFRFLACLQLALLFHVALARAAEPPPAAQQSPITSQERPQLEAEVKRLWVEAQRLAKDGKLPEAAQMGEQVHALIRRLLGDDHEDIAINQEWLADRYEQLEDFEAAKAARQLVLSVRTKLLGKDHWQVTDARLALAHTELLLRLTAAQRASLREADESISKVSALHAQGNFAEALPLAEKALAMRTAVVGDNQRLVGNAASWLGYVCRSSSDYSKAERLFRQVLEIDRNLLGEAHPVYATDLNNLAELYDFLGDSARAEPLYHQSLEIRKKVLGETHQDFSQSLNNLAELYRAMGEFAQAEPLYVQAIEIDRKVLGEQHPDFATDLNNLALLRDAQGDYARAEPLFQQAVQIRKQAVGEAHPDYATTLNNLALHFWLTGEYARAEPLYRQALAIKTNALGEMHRHVGQSVNNLGELYRATGDYARAAPLYKQALAIARRNLELSAAAQTESQQLAMTETVRYQLHNYLVLATQAAQFRESAYRELLSWKGAVLARQQANRAARDNPELRPAFAELEQVTAQLARQAFAVPLPARQAAWREKVAELSAAKEDLERQLAAASENFLRAREGVTLERLQSELPVDAVLIDLLQCSADVTPASDSGTKPLVEPRFVAFIVRKTGPVALVVLDKPEIIEEQIENWRFGFGRTDQSRAAALWLREHIWLPLEAKIGDAKTVLISPDGALGKLPFAALPGKESGKYLVEEERLLAVVPSAAAIVFASSNEGHSVAKNLLVLGGVDYNRLATADLAADKPAPRKFGSRAPREMGGDQFPPLPGTEGELATIKIKYEAAGFDPQAITALQQGAATEEAVRREAPRHKYLHFATHGFFAASTFKSALDRSSLDRSKLGTEKLLSEQSISGYNPNLLSGIVLAGAGHPPAEGDDGILTAEEVQTLDLRGAELVVLSACETGLGKTAGGEGILGLQRAFQVAGARTVIASLWRVDDAITRDLMERFYDHLWNKTKPDGQPYSKLEALREAQLWMLRDRGPRGATPDENDLAKAGQNRLPPYFWAAFVLSGDWR